TFAVDTISNGSITATATETADESANPPEDDITVNAGVTVQSTGGDVTFVSGDSIITQPGSVIQAAGAINLTIGNGDTDNDAVFNLQGTLIAGTINFTATGTIYFD